MTHNNKSRDVKQNYTPDTVRHKRTDPDTGQTNYYFPLEISDPSIRTLAKEYGLETGRTRLGNREFEAVMVPCKDTATVHGKQVFIDTPSDVQRARYLEYIKDEMKRQDAMKQDGRCNIPDGRGGTKRCPARVPNPAYRPGGDENKTIPVPCEGCMYEPFRQEHTFVEFSALSDRNEEGEIRYEPVSHDTYYEGDRYLRMQKEFRRHIEKQVPKLYELADLLLDGYTQSEASRLLDKSTSTVGYHMKKLRETLEEFLDETLII